MKRWLCMSIALCAVAAAARFVRAQVEDGAATVPAPAHSVEADTIDAARQNAVQSLYAEVSRLPLGGQWTVGSFLREIEGQDEFMKVMEMANQIGGPRWLNDTCTVQLRISTALVSRSLRQLGNARGKQAPLNNLQMDAAIRRWAPTVDATGSSVLPGALARIKPWRGDPWAGVDEQQRAEALEAANAIASRRVMESVGSVRLTPTTTIADGLAVPEVQQRVQTWLASRPVKRVNFQKDLEVEVAFAVERRDFYDVVRDALQRQRTVAVPAKDRDWKRVESDFFERCVAAVGRARVKGGEETRPVVQHVKLPERPPEWADEEIEVTGRSGAGANDLRAVAAADADAMATLRGRIEQLVIGEDLTVGELAKRDPAAAEAVNRFLSQVRPEQTDPGPEKGVRVRVRANLGGLWEELRRQ